MFTKRTLLLTTCIFSITLLVLPDQSHAAMPLPFKAGRASVSLENEYFWTTKNYDKDGNSVDFPDDDKFNEFKSRIIGEYILDGQWSLSGGMNFTYSQSHSLDVDRSNSRLTDAYVKAQYLLSWPQVRLIPEASSLFAFGKIDPNTDEVLTDEGVNVFTVGTWVIFPVARVKVYGYIGYQQRTDGRSALMPWNLGVSYRLTRWTFSGELNGYQSITDDEDTNNRGVRETLNSLVNGGSLRYYAVNPNLMQGQLRVDFQPYREFSFYGGLAQTVGGESTAAGTTALAGFTYFLDTGAEHDSLGPKGRKNRKKDQEFIPAVEEDYDESLFEPEEGDESRPAPSPKLKADDFE